MKNNKAFYLQKSIDNLEHAMIIDIPGQSVLEIKTIVLDLNGTLTIDGIPIEGIKERIEALKNEGLEFRLFTGDTLGSGRTVSEYLGLILHITKSSASKLKEGEKLGLEHIAVIGNGRIDYELFKKAALRICTLQDEGLYAPLLAESDVLVASVRDALDLFIHKQRLIATLRA
jgi:soluble P-type ATPase